MMAWPVSRARPSQVAIVLVSLSRPSADRIATRAVSSFSYPFALGLLAAVNPCGFPMLPAYLSYFVRDEQAPASAAPIGAAVRSAAAVSAGFVALFAALGALFEAGISAFMAWVPWVMILLAVGLGVLGLAGLAGRRIRLHIPHSNLGGPSRSLRSMFGFGLSYAAGSLTCSLPLFLAGVAGAFTRSGVLNGIATFVAYSLGMAAVLTVATVAVATARRSVIATLRRGGRHLDRIGSVLLIAVAAYLADYWISYLEDPTGTSRAMATVSSIQSQLTSWLDAGWLQSTIAVIAAVLAAAAALRWWGGRRQPAKSPS